MKLHEFADILVAMMAFQGYPDVPPPKMFVVPSTFLNRMYPQLKDARAIHDCKSHTIYMADRFNPDDVYDLATAAYESRRHLQCLDGRYTKECAGKRRAEAYAVATLYLRSRQVKVAPAILADAVYQC